MDRKGILIIVITLALALSYQFFIAAPRQIEVRKQILAAQQAQAEKKKQEDDARARSEAEAAELAAAKAKTAPVIIVVHAQLGGASPDDVKSKVSAPIEQQLATAENFVSAAPEISADGKLALTVSSKPGRDAARARQSVQDAVAQAQPKLPPEAKVEGVEKVVPALAASVGPAPTEKPTAPAAALEPPKNLKMSNGAGTVDYLFTTEGGGIATVTLREHFLDKSKGTNVNLNEFGWERMETGERPLHSIGGIPIGALVETAGDPQQTTAPWDMTSDAAAGTVTFTRVDKKWNIKITKTFTLPKKSTQLRDQFKNDYLVGLSVTYENKNDLPTAFPTPAYFLHAGSAAPTTINDQSQYQGFSWWREGRNTSKLVDSYSAHGWIFKEPEREVVQEGSDLIRWTGVTSQYFTTIITVLGGEDQTEEQQKKLLGKSAWSRRHEISLEQWQKALHDGGSSSKKLYQLDAALQFPEVALSVPGQAGSSVTRNFQIYAGPCEYRRLRLMDHSENDILMYGSFLGIPTGPVSRLLLNSMNGLYTYVTGQYALAIVLLTIILKGILWPLQSKANRSMKKMAVLSPQMKELQAKYKDEPQRYQQEIGKLFKKAGVNPLSGCWPILIQIPIFMGFYNMLGKAVELRHQGFWWVSDLSAPDTVGHILGLPINPLPLLMAVTMLLQMKLAPQGGDPAQRKMMMFMPVIFIVMCYNFASALALYWAVQNVISIVQLLVNRAKETSQAKPVLVK